MSPPRHDDLDKTVKELGCPYPVSEPLLCKAWLDGYAKGYKEATERAITSFAESFSHVPRI